jgi:hypothetical protein
LYKPEIIENYKGLKLTSDLKSLKFKAEGLKLTSV